MNLDKGKKEQLKTSNKQALTKTEFIKKFSEKTSYLPLLIVDNLPETFGKIDKNDKENSVELTENERITLTLIAKIIVEIFIKEEQ